jgi:YVTN family beta-propeller protein
MVRSRTVLILSAVLMLLLVPNGTTSAPPSLAVGPRSDSQTFENGSSNLSSSALSPASPLVATAGTLENRGAVGSFPSTFWSINAQTAHYYSIPNDSSLGRLVNSTPIRLIRYGEQSDQCDIANDTFWTAGNNSTLGIKHAHDCAFSIADFKVWCYSITPHCQSIITLPGVINNAAVDAYEAAYIVNTLSFQPTYWAIGNEPDNNASTWSHFNVPWTQWRTYDKWKGNATTQALQYAQDVRNATIAIRAVSGLASAQFIGIEAASSKSTPFFQDVAKLDGTNLSAVAYHSYPDYDGSPSVGPTNLTEYYEPLMQSRNISGSYAAVRADITGQCTLCSTMPIQLGEYNGGPSEVATPFDSNFSGAVFTAASIAQAIDAQVPVFGYFGLQSSSTNFSFEITNSADQVDAAGNLYRSALPYFAGDTIQSVWVRTTLTNVWAAMLTTNASDGARPVSHESFTSLLVVNANVNSSLSLNVSGVLSASMSGRIISWNNTTASPVSRWGSFNTSFTIPSQGILLLNGSLCASCLSVNLSAGSKPAGFGVSGANDMTYVAESGAHAVVAISATGAETSVSVPTCGHPSQLAYSPATTYIYVTCANSSKVVAISTSNAVVQTIAVGSAPGAITYDPANDYILVANYGSDTVSAISGVTVIKTISVGSGPTSLTYDVTNSYVYTTNSQSSNLTVMNATLVKLASPSTAADPIAAVVDSVGDVIVICNSSSSVRVFSGTSSTHTIALPSGSHPSAVAWETDSSLVVITEYSRNTLAVLSTGNWSVFTTISAPAGPNAIVWDSIDGHLYITCFLANSVFEVFVTIGFADLATGHQPVAVTWNPYYDAVGVAEYGSGNVWWSA